MKFKEINRSMLKEYNIYAGLGGGFGGAKYQYTSVYESEEEALEEAHQLAVEEYGSYEGMHGLLTYDEAETEARNLYPDGDEEDIENCISHLFDEDVDNWIKYYVVLTEEDTETDEDDLVRDYTIEDGDDSSQINCEGD